MSADFVAEQRGDQNNKSQDWYNRIDTGELKEEYDKYIFRLPTAAKKQVI